MKRLAIAVLVTMAAACSMDSPPASRPDEQVPEPAPALSDEAASSIRLYLFSAEMGCKGANARSAIIRMGGDPGPATLGLSDHGRFPEMAASLEKFEPALDKLKDFRSRERKCLDSGDSESLASLTSAKSAVETELELIAEPRSKMAVSEEAADQAAEDAAAAAAALEDP